MSNFDVSIILRMVDQLTAPARRAAQAVRSMQQSVQQSASAIRSSSRTMERPFVDALNRMQRKAVEFSTRVRKAFRDIAQGPGAQLNEMGGKLSAQRWQMMTTMFYAAPLALPFKMAATNELGLARLGQTAGWKEDEFSQSMEDRNQKLREIAKETRQSAADLLSVYTDMVAQGVPEQIEKDGKKYLPAMDNLRMLGKVMTATGMAAEDAAKLGFALREQFNITDPEQLLDVMGRLHKAGKLGGFELRDMARWFPELGAMTSMMGMSGPEFAGRLAAGLQVVRKGAPDPDAAGNNMVNLLQKMFQIETRKQFKKAMGVDLADELKKTVEAGGDPILRTVELAQQYMDKTGNAFLTGNLFADRQALLAILPLLGKGLQRWKEINAEVMSANREEILRDHATTVKTMWGAWRQLTNAVEWFSDTLVKAVLGDAGELVGGIADQVDRLNAFARENKPLMRGILLGFGGLVAAALGIRMVMFLFNSFKYAILGVWVALRSVWSVLAAWQRVASGPGAALARLAASFRAFGAAIIAGGLLARLTTLRAAMIGLGRIVGSALLGPIGGIALLLYSFVPDSWWTEAVERLKMGFGYIKDVVLSSVSELRQWLGGLSDAFIKSAEQMGAALKGVFGNLQMPSGPIMVNPDLRPGQTIPGLMDRAQPQVQQQNDNRTINNAVTVPITINATVNNTTPQGIAGAVSGAGQSVAGEVKKALSDGGQ